MRNLAEFDAVLAESIIISGKNFSEVLSILNKRNEILHLSTNFFLFANKLAGEKLYKIDNKIILKIPINTDQKERAFIRKKTEEIYFQLHKKWGSLGLKAPEGFIYIRVFSTLQGMRDEFALGEKVHGVTFPCRFVALPWDQGRIEFKNTLAHELVHAFFNGILGYENKTSIPRWLEEGLATNLSKDPGTHLVSFKVFTDEFGNRIKQDIYSTTSKEYMKWKSYFDYMISFYGKEKLGKFLQDLLKNASASRALNNIFSLPNETILMQNADKWLKKRKNFKFIMILFYVLGIFGFLIISMKKALLGIIGGFFILTPSFLISFTPYFRHTTIFPYISVTVIAVFFSLFVLTIISNKEKNHIERDHLRKDKVKSEESDESKSVVNDIDNKEAENFFREELRLNPKNADAHNSLGTEFHNQDRYNEAEQEYLIAIKLDSENPRYHADLAGNLFKQGKIEEANNSAMLALRLGFMGEHWIFQYFEIDKDNDS